MVEIDCPALKHILVQRMNDGDIELRFVSTEDPKGDRFNVLRPATARCIAHLLLAATEGPIEGKASKGMPLIDRREGTEKVELRLWDDGRIPLAVLPLSTARCLAYGLMTESHSQTEH
jgi:hypothetical protein